MKSGLKPIRKDWRDYSFHKTFGTVADPSILPESLGVDAVLWMPDQETGNPTSVPPVPPMPNGCTDYAQTDLCMDEDDILYNPLTLEAITHANANGGIDIRTSLKAAMQAYARTAYFNIQWQQPLDAFDSIRLAIFSTQNEKRAVSAGTPFFQGWLNPVEGILPIPASFNTTGLPWHNWVICGWQTIAGVPYLVCKMWLGPTYGLNGFAYMSRDLANAVFNISGSGAFTLSKVASANLQTVDMNVVDIIVSFIRNLIGLK